MADGRNIGQSCKETVCISCNRILDCCRDKDCFENVRVYLNDCGQNLIDKASGVRIKSADIIWTQLTVDPVQFNRGFYQVWVRFYVRVACDVCLGPGRMQEVEGIAVCEKKVILYGGEGCVNIFRSTAGDNNFCTPACIPEEPNAESSLPIAVCEVADPVVLDVKILEKNDNTCCCCCCVDDIPTGLSNYVNGGFAEAYDIGKVLAVSLGFFSVIRLERPGQFIINAREYSVPEKECLEPAENDPCSLFRRMQFPVDAFNPASTRSSGCGCGS